MKIDRSVKVVAVIVFILVAGYGLGRLLAHLDGLGKPPRQISVIEVERPVYVPVPATGERGEPMTTWERFNLTTSAMLEDLRGRWGPTR